jgi:DNA-binding NarL/FixJ family response regulator
MQPDPPTVGLATDTAAGGLLHDLTREATDHLTDLNRILARLRELVDPAWEQAHPGPGMQEDPSEGAGTRLTDRERQVLELLIRGLSNRLIARTLGITEPTVKNHLHSVFLKLQVTDRTQAIAKVLAETSDGGMAVRQMIRRL